MRQFIFQILGVVLRKDYEVLIKEKNKLITGNNKLRDELRKLKTQLKEARLASIKKKPNRGDSRR